MCMIAGAVTKEFGLLATDSAQYDTATGKMSFASMKLFYSQKYVLTFIGTPAYFSRIDRAKMEQDVPSVSLYLTHYLKKIKPEVEKILASEIKDNDENKPHFCLLMLGLHKGVPTLIQFNSFLDFEPKYLFTNELTPKFTSIYYGDDNLEKKQIFKRTTTYMETKARKYEKITPGILGEILTRGIYKKADMEEQIGPKKKYAGGVVNVAGMSNSGIIFPLSGISVA